nr:midnolin [Dromaius novaehollandiae]XP_025954662.1 midnolin [Dromaius novaehollandiae]
MDPQPSARSCSRGAAACELLPNEPSMNLCINTTTGTRYELCVPADETVEGLKRRLSQRLKVPKERLALLHKESRLSSGKLQDLGVVEGSKLTLVPTVEAGLMSQASRPEQSVMQALESLTETQVRGAMRRPERQRRSAGRSGGRDCRDLTPRPLPVAAVLGASPRFHVQFSRSGGAEGGARGRHRHPARPGAGRSRAAAGAAPTKRAAGGQRRPG